MVAFIDELLARRHGLRRRGQRRVLPRPASCADYGALAHRSADELREGAGARVEIDERKEDPLDFALWKAAKPGEPTWPSPWGPGRPGWHIECVAMSLDILGEAFDIHGGGDDLAFPHHENERAEAVGAGKAFARYWVHNAMVNVDGEKMSKSLGNFTTLAELLDNYDPRALRLLVLQTHYRKTMEINGPALDQALRGLERLDALARRMPQVDARRCSTPTRSAQFNDEVDDDLATPSGVAIIFETVRRANAAIDAGETEHAESLVATVHALSRRVRARARSRCRSRPTPRSTRSSPRARPRARREELRRSRPAPRRARPLAASWSRTPPPARCGAVPDVLTPRVSIEFDVHVRPGAKRTLVGGTHADLLAVAVAAPPADGQANDAVCRTLADAFGVRPSAVTIVRGHAARRKRMRVDGDHDLLGERLAELRG